MCLQFLMRCVIRSLYQVTATSLDRMGVNTRLEKCFLVAQNSSDKVMLVENNCPVDQYTKWVEAHIKCNSITLYFATCK